MGSSLRQSAAWLHTWSGLVVGWLLFFVFVTGTAGYFQHEITRWMRPELPLVQPQLHAQQDLRRMTALGLQRLEQMAPEASSWRITLPHASAGGRSWQEFGVRWQQVPEPGH
ncbi:PepSY-associated TM helix domain-containing protein, partial [Comamonas composti]|uniref:PepSY-associated TM helix domain-containing protein n=1 Tax=Comamonas composti TaxID=408558 RepID=UPI00054FE94E